MVSVALRNAVLVALLLVLFATASFAGREPEQWDDLPQIESFSFSQHLVGLGGRFVLERATSRMREVTAEEFARTFSGAIGEKAAEVREEAGIGATVVLRTSSGREFVTRDAYCAEGEGLEHALWLDGKPLEDHVNPCDSVSAAEIVGNQLWLGTRHDGELGEYPACGVIVQDLADGHFVKALGRKNGLSGNLIRSIRVDPFGETIWIATNEGLDEIDRDFGIRRTLFFYRELDPRTGAVSVGLSPTKLYFHLEVDPASGSPVARLGPEPRDTDPMATFILRLHPSDPKRLYDLLVSIPERAREQLFHGLEQAWFRVDDASSPASAFAPPEANVLVPFLIDAARSPRESERAPALGLLCAFNDRRVIDFLIEQRDQPSSPPLLHPEDIQRCLDKYAKLGLVSADEQKVHIASLVKQEQEALDRIHAATFTDTYPDIRLVVRLARELKDAGSVRGMELINDYFRAMDAGRDPGSSNEVHAQVFRDAKMYAWIATNLGGDSEITPAMLDGLGKFRNPMAVRSGCAFFDMRWPGGSRRFDVEYAEAILLAIDRRTAHEAPPPGAEDFCVEAFKSQLGDPAVREAFFREAYPRLTPRQKELGDRLSREPPTPPGRF